MTRNLIPSVAAALLLASCAAARVESRPPQVSCEELDTAHVPLQDERALGDAVAVKLAAENGGLELGSPGSANACTRYVATVGRALAQLSARPALPWRFGVLASSGPNALSMPGGTVLVTRGLLDSVKSEDQLAGVLAHEVAHVVLQHALNQFTEKQVSACKTRRALGGLGSNAQAGISQATGGILNVTIRTPFDDSETLEEFVRGQMLLAEGYYHVDRDPKEEFAADALAADLLLAVGYSPREYIRLLGGLPAGLPLVKTHPPPAERARALETHLEKRSAEPQPFTAPPRTTPVPYPGCPRP